VHTPASGSGSVADLFNAVVNAGADGQKNLSEIYSLILTDGGNRNGGHTGVETSLSVTNLDNHFGNGDRSIYLFQENGSIVGRVGGANGDVALDISIDSQTGQITV